MTLHGAALRLGDLRTVELIDPLSGTLICALYPLDKTAHASAARRLHAPRVPAPVLADSPAHSPIAPLLREGGFALISGDVGTGKSVALRLIAERLAPVPDLTVAALTHPSANLADFYRELGDLFAVELCPHNRWMMESVKVASLGQVSQALCEVGGIYRRNM